MGVVASLILSAGFGTRLAPLSAWRAKPLVPIGDRPAIAHIVDRVKSHSRVIVANAHHRAGDVAAYAAEAGLLVSREAEILGTAGGLSHAAELLGPGDVLVWNGDMIGDLDVAALLASHARHASRGGLATLAVRPRYDAGGNTGIDARGDIVRLRHETCRDGEERTADFLGVYVVTETLRRALPSSGDVIAASFLPAIRADGRIAAFSGEENLVDVGTPQAYLAANLAWLAGRSEPWWGASGACVDSRATLKGVVLGAGARVTGEGEVVDCVVWPGGVLRAPMRRAIVAPEGVVQVALQV
jgi:mannose-1-phosphate guanylyltransferase